MCVYNCIVLCVWETTAEKMITMCQCYTAILSYTWYRKINKKVCLQRRNALLSTIFESWCTGCQLKNKQDAKALTRSALLHLDLYKPRGTPPTIVVLELFKSDICTEEYIQENSCCWFQVVQSLFQVQTRSGLTKPVSEMCCCSLERFYNKEGCTFKSICI